MNNQKIVLVTGASSGIGKITVQNLLSAGYIVYGTARRIELMKDLEKLGAHIFFMDVTKEDSMAQGVQKIIAEQGRIDILINNAGYGSYGAIEDVSIEEAKRQFEVNIFGLARITQLVLPYMRSQKFGKIVNISSIAGKTYSPMGGWYHSSKHALEGLSDCLRVEVKDFGIDVIIIEPGLIETEWEGIAVESAIQTSGNTVYAKYVNGIKKLFSQLKPAPPQLIASVILKSIQAKNPKTRYVAGTGAKPLLFLRKMISDKTYDSILKKMMK